MLQRLIGILVCHIFLVFPFKLYAQLPMFAQNKVNRIDITMPQDSLNAMWQTLNSVYYMCSFTYSNGVQTDTIDSVGIRYRGNTSLGSKKKSIKLAIDKFIPQREYKGLRKLNLIGNHNDATYIRERLFYECWQRAGLPPRRFSFVEVYINGINFGLYSNAEEIDKQWLKRVYNNDSGNLYKCSWGADLKYINDNGQTYKNLNGGNTYDLQTNSNGNYSDLALFIKRLNATGDNNYLPRLDSIFDYRNYLKAYALEILCGHWDNYAYNKNNYILWHDSVDGKFKYISFDADNTFGIDWVGVDWTTRNPYVWHSQTEYRPLCQRLLDIPSCKQIFAQYLDSLSRYVVHEDSLFGYIDSLQVLLAPFVPADSFKKLDYGYDSLDFVQGFIGSVDNHSPNGIKPFISKRRFYLVPASIAQPVQVTCAMYPNPASSIVHLQATEPINEILVYDMQGKVTLKTQAISHRTHTLDVGNLSSGLYLIQINTGAGTFERNLYVTR